MRQTEAPVREQPGTANPTGRDASRKPDTNRISKAIAKLIAMEESESVEPGIGEGPAKAISVSLPEGTVRALRGMVGPRGVSALIATAIEEHLRNLATAAYLAEYEDEYGDFAEDEKRAAADVWARAEQRESQWRAAG